MGEGNFVISEDHVERAIDWVRDNASEAAQARAERIYLDEYSKALKAKLMSEHKEKPLGAQEREALDSDAYATHLEALKIAIEIDEKNRYMRAAAEAKIEAWRTQSSNIRALKI